MVQEAATDDTTIAFLLSQTLMAQQRAEEEAKEAKEVEDLEAALASKEQWLPEELEMLQTSPDRGRRSSPVEVAAAWLFQAKLALWNRQRRKEKKRRKLRRRPWSLFSCSS